MAPDLWLAFMAAIFIVILVPGPLSMLMVVSTVNHGLRKSIPAFAGGVCASLVLLTISASGLGALIIASPTLFKGIQYAGAAWLLWLAWQGWQRPKEKSGEKEGTEPPAIKGPHLFLRAFMLGSSNPKDIMFFIAFLPQFIDPARAISTQLMVMTGSWLLADIICKTAYGLSAKSVAPALQSPGINLVFNRVVAILFVAAAGSALIV